MGETPELVNAVASPEIARVGEKREVRRRGRSITVRSPEDSTNAAYNIRKGNYNRLYYHSPQTRQLENQNDCSSVVTTTALADRYGSSEDTAIVYIMSFVLLAFAVIISLMLEDLMDEETEM